MYRKTFVLLLAMILLPSMAWSFELYRNDKTSLSIGYWGQAWYQYVSDHGPTGDETSDSSLNEFMLRRSYLNLSGTVTQNLSFFLHYAADRIGQDDLDSPGMGVGTGLAVRDAWVNYRILGNNVMVQAGCMYIPFTRDYGTTSTKGLMTSDLNWGQGGTRSNIIIPARSVVTTVSPSGGMFWKTSFSNVS